MSQILQSIIGWPDYVTSTVSNWEKSNTIPVGGEVSIFGPFLPIGFLPLRPLPGWVSDSSSPRPKQVTETRVLSPLPQKVEHRNSPDGHLYSAGLLHCDWEEGMLHLRFRIWTDRFNWAALSLLAEVPVLILFNHNSTQQPSVPTVLTGPLVAFWKLSCHLKLWLHEAVSNHLLMGQDQCPTCLPYVSTACSWNFPTCYLWSDKMIQQCLQWFNLC